MTQNIEVIRMRKHKLWMNDIVFAEENIIFASGQFNGLFKAGIHGGEAEFLNFFPNHSRLQPRLYGNTFQYQDEILFLPDLSEYITLYNIIRKDFIYIRFPIENRNPVMQYWPQVVGGILVGSCVYAFAAKYPCVVCYDFETKQLETYTEEIERFEMNGYETESVFFSQDIYQRENSIFVRSNIKDLVVEFDMETKKFDFYRAEKQSLSNFCKEAGQNFQCSILFKNKIWLFPYLSGSIMIVDVQNGKRDTLDLFEKDLNKWNSNDALGAVWFRKIYKDKLYFMSVLENKLYCFSDNEKEEFRTDFYVDKSKIIRLLFPDKKKFQEPQEEKGTLWRINYDLIDAVLSDDWDEAEQKGNQTEVGKVIYDYLTR